MTELEKHIYDCAKNEIPKLLRKIKNYQKLPDKIKYIEFPFYCDGIIDTLVYDIEQKRFTKIKYRYAKENITSMDGFSEFTCLCDDYEIKCIEL